MSTQKLYSLEGLIDVERSYEPPMIFFCIQKTEENNSLNLRIESYVSMRCLPRDLTDQIRSYVESLPKDESGRWLGGY